MKKENYSANIIRNGLFLAPSRTYGEQYIEPFIRYKYNFSHADDASYDAKSKQGIKYEIKSCKVLESLNEQKATMTLIEQVAFQNNNLAINRLVRFADSKDKRYDANVQNVKRDHFDYLIYVLLFEDCVKIFKTHKTQISSIPSWSDKHGRYDQLGKSGQFPITKNNIEYHVNKNLIDTVTYDEIRDAFFQLSVRAA